MSTHFGDGQDFFNTWQAWKADPQRPARLHYCAIDAQPLSADALLQAAHRVPVSPNTVELSNLAATLAAQWFGLLPGFHRISLDNGKLLLTLCVGEVKAMLRELAFTADSLFLHDPNAGHTGMRFSTGLDFHLLKALARCCEQGTRFALHRDGAWHASHANLTRCGFVPGNASPTSPTSPALHALPPSNPQQSGSFAPHWNPKTRQPRPRPADASRCVVIGGGLAGAAVANSLARRGWQVQVLDANPEPAQGASGLPAGLVVPQVSPDDNVLSQLSRSGLRVTLQQAQALLQTGADWQHSGVLEHRVPANEADSSTPLDPTDEALWQGLPDSNAGKAWSHRASALQLQLAGLPPTTSAFWHPLAAWIKPAALVRSLLNHPHIRWRGDCAVAALRQQAGQWQLQDQHGVSLAEAPLVVVTAAFGSQALLATTGVTLAVQPVRGQISWGRGRYQDAPPFPVNGHGSLISGVSFGPKDAGEFWTLGSSYERNPPHPQATADEIKTQHQENHERLRVLLPQMAEVMAPALLGVQNEASCEAFIGIRCASRDRLPLVGPLVTGSCTATASPDQSLWLSTAMGSRGLTFALLCAELLAARLHGEPWPIAQRLAKAIDSQR